MFFQIQKNLPPNKTLDCPSCLCEITTDEASQGDCAAHPKLPSGWFQSVTQFFSPATQMDHYSHKHCLEAWRQTKKEDFHCPECRQPAANHEPLKKKPTLMQRLSQVHPSLNLLSSSLLTLGTVKTLEPLLGEIFPEALPVLSSILIFLLATNGIATAKKTSWLGASLVLGSIAPLVSSTIPAAFVFLTPAWLGSKLLQKKLKTKIDLCLTTGATTAISGLAAAAFGASPQFAAILGFASSIFYFPKG